MLCALRIWSFSAGLRGVALLQDGVWNGEQILPPGWVKYSTTPTPAFGGYGAGWWLQFPGDLASSLGCRG